MISKTAEYALRAVVYLGNQGQTPCTTAHISEAIDAPASYLAKVMKGLGRAGIVDAQRGLHGGFMLAREPGDLTVLEVVNAVDAFHRMSGCPLGRPAHTSGLCPLHRRMDYVMAAAERSFGATTVDELIDGPSLSRLCSFPCISEPAASVAVQAS